MALLVQNMARKFVIDKKTITLDDPNPKMAPDEVMSFYSNVYPELTTSTVHGPEIEDGQAVYTFKTTVGTKG